MAMATSPQREVVAVAGVRGEHGHVLDYVREIADK